jgi:hypothetical protein
MPGALGKIPCTPVHLRRIRFPICINIYIYGYFYTKIFVVCPSIFIMTVWQA